MKVPFITTWVILFSLASPWLLQTAFCGDAREPQARLEIAQLKAIKRGERIQPLAPNVALTNAAPILAKTNLVVVTNRVAEFKDGSLFGFEKLAGYTIQIAEHLDYATNAPLADVEVNGKIPANIRAMDGRTILVSGYMTPLDYNGGKTKQFILSRNPSGCCYGDMPLIHEMIEVRMKGEGVPVFSYVPVQVQGVLRVGAKRNGEALACIYRLDAETVDEAER